MWDWLPATIDTLRFKSSERLGAYILSLLYERPFGADIQANAACGAQDRVDADVLVFFVIMIDQGRTFKMLDAITATVAFFTHFDRYIFPGLALPGPVKYAGIS